MVMAERTITVRREPGGERQPHWSILRFALALLAAGPGLLIVGLHEPVTSVTTVAIAKGVGLAALWATYVLPWIRRADRRTWVRHRSRELVALTLTTLVLPFSWPAAAVLHLVLAGLLLTRCYVVVTRFVRRPGLLLLLTFAGFSLAGTLLLKLPAATPVDHPISWLDACFTATSAVCVTGLIVRDTATEFTAFGQILILFLIQLGGLGIILFGAVFASMIGGQISLRHAASISEAVQTAEGGLGDVESLVRFVITATLLTEAAGALLIYLSGAAHEPGAVAGTFAEGRPIFVSIFLSISAFCNAGFAPFTESLIPLRFHWVSHLVIAPLIVLGGLGFVALYDLWRNLVLRFGRWLRPGGLRSRRPTTDPRTGHLLRLGLHTRIVLVTTLILYLAGLLVIFTSQMLTPGDPQLSIGEHLLDASFMSITCRTAGFNTMPMDDLAPASVVMSIVLMAIGGSPGSMAGGIKTVTVAVLALTVWSTLRGRPETEVMRRTIPEALVRRAGVLAMLGLLAVAILATALSLTRTPGETSTLVFEAVSATSTVGLSLGVTPMLSPAGRVIVIVAMFLGRVGPLALLGALAFASPLHRSRYRYPSESVVMG